jgi:hypothetical protein
MRRGFLKGLKGKKNKNLKIEKFPELKAINYYQISIFPPDKPAVYLVDW